MKVDSIDRRTNKKFTVGGVTLSRIFPCLLPSAFSAITPSPPASPAGTDIRGIVAPQPFYIAGSYWLLLVAAVCVLAAIAVGWFLYRSLKKPKPVHVPSPHEVAYARLNDLRARLDALDPRGFGAEAADILRAFIGSQYGLRPQRQTSPEFLESIRGATVFTTTQHVILGDFLNHCDLLKFARQDATRDAKLALIEQATTFLGADSRPSPLLAPAEPALASSLTPPPLPSSERYPYESPESRYMPPDTPAGPAPAEEPAAPASAS